MAERHIKNISAVSRKIDDIDVTAMQYGLFPCVSVGDELRFSMHITDGFVILEFDKEYAGTSISGDNHLQCLNSLAEFFEKYDTNTRFVLVEKIINSQWEMGQILPENE